MHFVRITEDDTRDDIAEAALHLRKRQSIERDPWIKRALGEDIDELLELFSSAVRVKH